MKLRWTHLLLAIAASVPASALGEELQVKVETVLTGLTNPCGVAIQPSTQTVFVSDTGAGQIIKLVSESKSAPVITDFPQANDTNNKEPTYSVGPLGLAFLNQNTLLTGEGALKQGDEVVRVFELPTDGKPLKFDDAKQMLHPTADPKANVKGSGNFFGLASTSTALFVTAHGPDDTAWVLKSDLKSGGTYDELKPFVQNKAVTKIDALLGLVVYHGFLVLGPRSASDKPDAKDRRQSLLGFYSAKSGNLLMGLPTGRHDITGLAYSPKSGRLYAVDFAWDDPSQGGLYRLDAATIDNQAGVKAVKMAALDKPSTLVFTSDNVLYVTTFGSLPTERKSDKPANPGKLLKITGDL